jgi:hypothetical protein
MGLREVPTTVTRAHIEEARRRAPRRRIASGGVLVVFVVVAMGLLSLKGPASSPSSLAAAAGPGAPGPQSIAYHQHVYVGTFDLQGKRGNVMVYVHFESSGRRSWQIGRSKSLNVRQAQTGQYRSIGFAFGERVQAGGHAGEWYARLFGVVTAKRQPAIKQRVRIELRGRPSGTFTLIPIEPGFLKRDSGTQSSGWMG